MAEITELQVQYTQGVITGNFDVVKASIEAKIADYTNVVYTVDTVKEAKKDIADLRKIRKVIDDKRKEIKKTWNDPYAEFEKLTKELIAIIDKPIDDISSQIEDFEKQRKEEKRVQIQSEYDKRFDSTIAEYCPLESFFEEKWLNSTTTMKSIKDALDAKKEFIKSSIKVIKDCGEETEAKSLKMFKETLDLQAVLAWINQFRLQKEEILKQQREEEQERQRKAEEERIRKEEQERQAKAEAERKEAEEKANKEMLQDKQPISQPGGFDIPTSQQGFASEVPQEQEKVFSFNSHTDGTSSITTDHVNTYPTPSYGFGGFQQEQQTGFTQSEQQGFAPVQSEQGFASQPIQGFGGFQQEKPKDVIFTVTVQHEMANHFEELIKQWGYTNFSRR